MVKIAEVVEPVEVHYGQPTLEVTEMETSSETKTEPDLQVL